MQNCVGLCIVVKYHFSGLKIRRWQHLASSSLAPGTKLNQGLAQEQALFLSQICIPCHAVVALSGATPKTGTKALSPDRYASFSKVEQSANEMC